MLIVPLADAKVGMKLAADLIHPQSPDQILLRRGFVLEESVLGRLRELGVIGIYVDYPDLTDLDKHLAPSLSPERLQIYSHVKATVAAVEKRARPTVGFADYYVAMRSFVITLFQQGEHPLYLEQMALRLGDEGVAHATAVAHLALLLGIRLQTYLIDQRKRLSVQHASEVVNLGIAGMLHDIGKCRVAETRPSAAKLSSVRDPDDADDCAAWESHPRVGYDMVRNGIEPSASVAILQHHQRFDGTGFPALQRKGLSLPLQGTEIHVFARVLAAANLFDRLTHGGAGPSGPPVRRPPVQVLHLLRTQYAAWLDPVVFTALQRVVPPFPPGSRVRLNDGHDAVVSGVNPRDPYRPLVRRLAPDGWSLQEKVISLALEEDLDVVMAEGTDVRDIVPERKSLDDTALSTQPN